MRKKPQTYQSIPSLYKLSTLFQLTRLFRTKDWPKLVLGRHLIIIIIYLFKLCNFSGLVYVADQKISDSNLSKIFACKLRVWGSVHLVDICLASICSVLTKLLLDITYHLILAQLYTIFFSLYSNNVYDLSLF